jgi:hypothetical protein
MVMQRAEAVWAPPYQLVSDVWRNRGLVFYQSSGQGRRLYGDQFGLFEYRFSIQIAPHAGYCYRAVAFVSIRIGGRIWSEIRIHPRRLCNWGQPV